MSTLVRRYAHVPLGIVSLLSILAVIAWLVVRRVDGIPDSAARDTSQGAVAPVATVTEEVSSAPPAGAPPEAPVVAASLPAAPAPSLTPARPPAERYALESGPFASSETADQREDALNRLGYATVRFRKQALARAYVVVATGFGSVEDAERAASELGRGTVVETGGAAEVMVQRVPALRDAVTVARALRGRGFEVRVGEEVTPTVIYHIRYGQFTSHAVAQARGQELARQGLESRVVKVR